MKYFFTESFVSPIIAIAWKCTDNPPQPNKAEIIINLRGRLFVYSAIAITPFVTSHKPIKTFEIRPLEIGKTDANKLLTKESIPVQDSAFITMPKLITKAHTLTQENIDFLTAWVKAKEKLQVVYDALQSLVSPGLLLMKKRMIIPTVIEEITCIAYRKIPSCVLPKSPIPTALIMNPGPELLQKLSMCSHSLLLHNRFLYIEITQEAPMG